MQEKRKVLLCLGILIVIVSVVGMSYALWQLTLTQTGTNVVTSGCFKVEFTDQNPIQLTNAYPITNEEGASLTPYEFTITNTCESEASYQVNLEVLNDSTFTELGYIREMLNEKGSTNGSRILTRNKEVEKTLENASLAYKLSNGVLAGNASKTFEFRLWMDHDTPAIESVMEKTLNSKITVITSYKAPVDTTNMMIAMEINKIDESTQVNNTYTQGDKYESTLNEVIFESVKNPIEGALEVKDFSMNQDESVLGYYVGNESEVKLHIQANGKIKVNPNGSYYFSTGGPDPSYTFEGFENLDTSEVTDMTGMFMGLGLTASSLLDLSHFDTSNVTNMNSMFMGMMTITTIDLSGFDTSNVRDMSSMFYLSQSIDSLDVSSFDTSNVTNMEAMFSDMSSLTSLDLSGFDTSNVKNMRSMFERMIGLTSLDLSHFDTSNVTDMGSMFGDMSNLIYLDVSHFDTSNVTNMNSMFSNIEYLTELNVTHFDTSKVTDMSFMFFDMRALSKLDLTHFNTSNVTNMEAMFEETHFGSLDVSHFDTSNVINMGRMFVGVKLANLDLSHFNTSNVTNMQSMFEGADVLTNIIYGDKFIHNENATIIGMFSNCPANKPIGESWNGVSFE